MTFQFHLPLTIERGVPLPDPATKHGRKYPLREMQPGDSFFLPSLIPSGLYGAMRSFPDRLYVTRRRTENGVRGLRVWRVE